MRIIETKVYTYDELSDEAKKKALDHHREPYSDWHEDVYADATELGALLGITIDRIYYSGFWSQGDGACFEGSYRYAPGSVQKIKVTYPEDKDLHSIASRLSEVQRKQFYALRARLIHRGHYYHSGCMAADVWNDHDMHRNIGGAEADILALLREFADWIYKQLEKEYDHLTSDENVEVTIKLNEYEFTEDGEMA